MGFGGIERKVSDQDFELGAYQPPESIPEVYKPDLSTIPIYDQDKYPTCGAHAGAFLDSKLQADSQGVFKHFSPKYLWAQIKQIDGFPLEDGTDMRSIFQSLVKTGDCDISLLPNSLGASLQAYSNIANVTPTMKINGAGNLLKNYAFTNNPSWEQLRQAIYKNKAVLALVNIGDGWWLPDWAHVLPLKLGNKVGRHFVVLHSYDQNRIYFRNSWGMEWGEKGDGYFERSYLQNVIEIGTSILLPNHFIFTKDMQRGDSNNDVIQLQRRLGVTPDSGWFGPLTYNAVIKYQTANGITPISGYVGPKTRQKLNTT